jgi:glycosyltransferase involved in cell wall biosynthesis
MNSLTVTLITMNEERNLPRVLASLGGLADELIVADSGSTDRTQEIALKHGGRFLVHAWTGFADQRNFADAHATRDWVLALDADEELSAELRGSLRAWKQASPEFEAYEFSRRANYVGGWIHHSGWYPDRKTRLYRRGFGCFEGAAHDSFRTRQRVGRLRGDLLHHAFATREEHAAKVESYSSAAAHELYARGKRDWRGAMYMAAPWTFFRKVFLQAGFLDGRRGWWIARESSRYTRLKYRKLGALIAAAKVGDRESEPDPHDSDTGDSRANSGGAQT